MITLSLQWNLLVKELIHHVVVGLPEPESWDLGGSGLQAGQLWGKRMSVQQGEGGLEVLEQMVLVESGLKSLHAKI